MSDAFDISGLRVLVTGSSRGLGAEIATYLASCGARIAVHGRDRARLDDVAGRIADAVVVDGDARDAEAVRAFVAAAAEGLGGLDAVVNNAGGSFGAPAAEMSANAFGAVVSANLTSAFLVAQAALPHLHGGTIVNIGSIAGLRATPYFAHYSAAKAGLVGLTRSLAAEWAGRVRVNAVFPTTLATEAALEQLFGNDPALIEAAARKTGVGRLGEPRDVAMAVRYLISSAAAFVNGEILVLDGGPSGEQPW